MISKECNKCNGSLVFVRLIGYDRKRRPYWSYYTYCGVCRLRIGNTIPKSEMVLQGVSLGNLPVVEHKRRQKEEPRKVPKDKPLVPKGFEKEAMDFFMSKNKREVEDA